VCGLLQVDNVSFAYGHTGSRGQAAPGVLDRVSIDVAAGELVGVLGPNGSGKTTLLKLVGGVLKPKSGHVRLDGADITTLPRRALARRLAVVPQDTSLTFDYSVLEVVLMGRYAHLGAFELEGPRDLAAAFTALAATGTDAFATRQFRTLSGGEQQRVIIASALAQLDRGQGQGPGPRAQGAPSSESSLLLLDEPTTSLDLRYQLEVAALLKRLHQESGVTMLISTHDLRLAASVCTRLVLLSRGRVLADGPLDDVMTPSLIGELFGIDPAIAEPVLPR
jgi:ABC-type cobalamin/Fe3+-siderophores transport system ATPase subunit